METKPAEPGAAPSEIETQITQRIESAMTASPLMVLPSASISSSGMRSLSDADWVEKAISALFQSSPVVMSRRRPDEGDPGAVIVSGG